MCCIAACQSSEKFRVKAVDHYNNGQTDAAMASIERAIAREHDEGADLSSPESWDIGNEDVSLYALEHAMISLRAGDPEAAHAALIRTREVLRERRVDNAAEFAGVQDVESALSLIADERSLDYSARGYEELTMYAMLALCDALTVRQSWQAYLNQFLEARDGLRGSDASGEKDPMSAESLVSSLPWGEYLCGVVAEAAGRANIAKGPIDAALSRMPENVLVIDTADRLAGGISPAGPGQGVVHVWFFLGNGPTFSSSKFDLTESDPLYESVNRLILQIIDVLRAVLLDEDYEWDDVLLLQLTQTPIPVPVLERNENPIPVVRASSLHAIHEIQPEVFADYYELAEARLEVERERGLARAVARRLVKYLASEGAGALIEGVDEQIAQEFEGASKLISFISQLFEDADQRSWGTLPAQIQVARMVLPEGVHEIDLGIATTKVRVGVEDAFIVVIAPDTVSAPTVLVDRLCAVEPEPVPDLVATSDGEETAPPSGL